MNIARIPSLVPRPVEHPAAPGTDTTPARDAAPAATSRASSLWEVLTPEEREFFAREQELGPLTYRPGGVPAPKTPPPTGRRIDVKG